MSLSVSAVSALRAGIRLTLYAAVFFMPWHGEAWSWCLLLGLAQCIPELALSRTWKPFSLPGAALLLFAAWAYMTTWGAPDVAASGYNYWYHVGGWVGFYFLLRRYLTARCHLNRAVGAFVSGLLVVLGTGFYQYFVESIRGTATAWTDAERFPLLRRRMYSTLGNPNLLAAYLLLAGAAMVGVLAALRRGRDRRLVAAMLIVTAVALALTYSRGAWVAAVVMWIVAAACWQHRLAWGLPLIPLFIIGYHGQITERMVSLFSGTDTSVLLRFAFWNSTLQMIADAPWTGIGWGAYVSVYPQYDYYVHNADVLIYHAHNMYLHIAAETGLIGLLLFLAAFWGHGMAAYRTYRTTDHGWVRGASLAVLLATAGMTISGLTDYAFFNRSVALTYWFLCGLWAAARQQEKKVYNE